MLCWNDPVTETGAISWIDGELVATADATVSAFDHGLVVGDGAFETLLIERGTPFAMARHIRRLHTTLAALAIAAPAEALLRRAMTEVTEANGVGSGKLRLTVTGGAGPLGSGAPHGPARVIAAVQTLGDPPVARAITVPWTRNEAGALAGLKTTSYAENVRALRYAHEQRAGEALFANTRGELCEGTGTNVVVVLDGRALTPPLTSGCLAGVTRELLLERGVIEEQPLPFEALAAAEEVWLTSSTRCVQPMESVDQRQLGGAAPLARAAMAAFADLLVTDLDP